MMKRFTSKSVLLLMCICTIAITAHAQTGSVILKDGSGTVVNTYDGIEAAYAAIPATITQPYLIEFNSTYNGSSEALPIALAAKTGASSTNTITIRQEAGNTTSSINVNVTTAIFQLAGADYVIFDGRAGGVGNTINFEIINTGTSSTSCYDMLNGSTNNVLRYVSVKRNIAASTACIAISNSLSAAGNGCSYNLVEYCKTEGGSSGINFKGTAASPSLFITIRNCVIANFFAKGIDGGSNVNEILIEGCTVYQSAIGNTTAATGIALASSSILGSFIVRNNIVRNMDAGTTGLVNGISILHGAADTGYVYNNMISITNNGFGAAAIVTSASTAASTLYIYHNTINVGGTSTASSATGIAVQGLSKNTSANTKWVVKNNIINITRTGTGKYVALNIADSSGLTMDYNCYTAPTCIRWRNTTDYVTLADFKAVEIQRDIHSISKAITFASASDLHLSGTSASDVELLGTTVADVTTDIDGESRSVTSPFMGADENAAPLPVELISFDAKKQDKGVLIRWTTASENQNAHFEIERSADAKDFHNIGRVYGSGYSSSILNYSLTDELPLAGTSYYRLKQVDMNGSYTYSKIVAVTSAARKPEIRSVNPYTGRVEFYNSNASSAFLEIYDMQGRRMYAKEEQVIEGVNSITFRNASLPRGIYVLVLRNAGGFTAAQKFVQ